MHATVMLLVAKGHMKIDEASRAPAFRADRGLGFRV